ncbi:hypothetical protein DXX98_00950 [Janibacter melonis]|nr:hypothetical protein [Janibacter melonis]
MSDVEIEVRQGDRAGVFFMSAGDVAATSRVTIDLENEVVTTSDGSNQSIAVKKIDTDASCSSREVTYAATGETTIARELFAQYWGWDKARASLTERVGSYHSLGVVVGGVASGTTGVTSSTEMSVSGLANRRAYNDVRYEKFDRWSCVYGHQQVWRVTGMPKPMSYIGWESTRPSFRYCAKLPKGRTISRISENNRKYSGGLTVKGVGLSAEADWSEETRMYINPRADSTVCGDTDYYGEAERLEIHKAMW